jgi:hypothetical protein
VLTPLPSLPELESLRLFKSNYLRFLPCKNPNLPCNLNPNPLNPNLPCNLNLNPLRKNLNLPCNLNLNLPCNLNPNPFKNLNLRSPELPELRRLLLPLMLLLPMMLLLMLLLMLMG